MRPRLVKNQGSSTIINTDNYTLKCLNNQLKVNMQFLSVVLLYLASVVVGKNILLTNDDSFSSTNIRATYYKLKDAGMLNK